MPQNLGVSRRALLVALTACATPLPFSMADAAIIQIKVWKDPNCGCCSKWVAHLARNGFTATVLEVADMGEIKTRLGVPPELNSCHTAEVEGYLIEGHVPATAIKRLLDEKPSAKGLAVPGMPIGSPGMEGGQAEIYDVVLFGNDKARSFGRYLGDGPV